MVTPHNSMLNVYDIQHALKNLFLFKKNIYLFSPPSVSTSSNEIFITKIGEKN